ncbi:1-phosphatidylinositol 4,5-bisphosphate phosphodiesterase gamma-1 [Armadillidium nasatum]|uniref:Phosphoinositide phospholipase C n=1 Tax=Armadillidium nasatum TaxID=96803 RepID=A0A5N5SQT5_9CRUS|nr:1-phosphatidylinositol 4,5-bisphosphate phosphodiesterase gamma-1 [Armadillidium nasatum]
MELIPPDGFENEGRAFRLERGMAVRKFCARKRPEQGHLMIRRETSYILFTGCQTGKDVITSLYDIKEVRRGKNSRDFEKWPIDARTHENSWCFVVFYGNEFKLKTLSVAMLSETECNDWLEGLHYLGAEAQSSPYIVRLQRSLRVEFYLMENQRNKVNLKNVSRFLPKIFYKMKESKLKSLFSQVDRIHREEINFDQFFDLLKKIIWEEQRIVLSKPLISSEPSLLDIYSKDGKIVDLEDFEKFLSEEQNEVNITDASQIIRNFIQDPQRNVQRPYFFVEEFAQYLYSKENEVWDGAHNTVTQDMTQPLSHYWIASSHNTYLTGDQLASESSTEAYARVLRQGCRCIELDCWNTPDGKIYIYHGLTFTSRIRFLDVIKTIKEHAFVSSEYPVILSIEDHCAIPQQREMARLFKEVFGDSLLTLPLLPNEKLMPSPEALKWKIILKHRKLPEGSDESTPVPTNIDEMGGETELSNSRKNGILYQRNPVDNSKWLPQLFVLVRDRICYSEERILEEEDDDDDDESQGGDERGADLSNGSQVDNFQERHLTEKWYHGRLAGGRTTAEELIQQYSYLGDGTFLVRLSENYVGDHSLSFWYKGKVNHCRIQTRYEGNTTHYYLKEEDSFKSIYELVRHYKIYPIRSSNVTTTLGEPVPQPYNYKKMEWYHSNLSREAAEDILRRIHQDGVFLVRPSTQEQGKFTVSFRAEGKINHCRISYEDNAFVIGTASFESLVDLIKYYQKNRLYRQVKLKYPISERFRRNLVELDNSDSTSQSRYVLEPSYVSNLCVKAKYPYKAKRADELTFPKHAIIQNVNKVEENWWRGDYGGRQQHWFPAVFVHEIEPQNNEEREDRQVLGPLQKGSFNISGAELDICPLSEPNRQCVSWVIKIKTQYSMLPIELGCTSQAEAQEWLEELKNVASRPDIVQSQREIEREGRVAKELSDLIVYFRCVNFDQLKHLVGMSRVYPKSVRFDSSNYLPIPMWNHGCQMVSMNYQTGDRAMQVNEGRFLQNGRCGYVLRPKFQFDPNYDPSDIDTLPSQSFLVLSLKILGARHLIKLSRGNISPLVEVEILGCDYDNAPKYSTKVISENGLCPVWCVPLEFTVHNPECAFIRFVVYDEDMFGEPNQIGQCTYPVTCLRQGFRSVPLKNAFSEEFELASLLIHLKMVQQEGSVADSDSHAATDVVRTFSGSSQLNNGIESETASRQNSQANGVEEAS